MPLPRILSIGALLICPVAFAQETSSSARWISDPANGCRVWSDAPARNETVRWNGPCPNGYAQGRGVLQWYIDGSPARRDEGEFRDGKLSGAGSRIEPDGGRYEGLWRGSRAHGEGRYVAPNGNVFEGFWHNGCLDQGTRRIWVGAAPAECSRK